jgi:hypothetical protein
VRPLSPTTDRRLASIVFTLVALAASCTGRESARSGAAAVTYHAARPARSDSALATWLEWHRDWGRLVNRHRAELDVEVARRAAEHPGVQQRALAVDPDYLAIFNRQREEMREMMARAPHGLIAEGLAETLLGIGKLTGSSQGTMVFLPGRDDVALSAARAKYGDDFVQWVLSHEAEITSTLADLSPRQ